MHVFHFHFNLRAHITSADIQRCVRRTLWGKGRWDAERIGGLEPVATTASDWLTAPRLSMLMRGGKHPLLCTVTGLTVIWGDVLSADFQIHKSLRSDEIEAAWKARRGDWHVWVSPRCMLMPHNAYVCMCSVCVCGKVFVTCMHCVSSQPTYACICMRA